MSESEKPANEKSAVPTSAVLMASSKHIALRCGGVNKAYLECKKKDNNPATCLGQGKAVTACTIDVLKDCQAKASDEFKAYTECMDYFSNRFDKCRKEQKAFEEKLPVTTP